MDRPASAIVDPGLQPERTDHAWRRTGFSFLAVGGLMLHMADGMSHVLGFVFGVPVLIFAVWVHRNGHRRYRQAAAAVRQYGVRGRVMHAGYIRFVTAGVIALQLSALLLTLNAALHPR